MKKLALAIFSLAVILAVAAQYRAQDELRTELMAVRQQLTELESSPVRRPAARPDTGTLISREPARMPSMIVDPAVEQRLMEVEDAIADLQHESRYLMDRGQLPPNAAYLAELKIKFLDAATSDKDRIQALRILRRGDGLDDNALQFTANWMLTLPDERVREDLLRNLEGMTNAVLGTAFVQLAMQNGDARVREQAVDNLRRYINDPQVEALMWDRMRNDPESRVRDEASSALRSGPFSETRIANFKQYAMNPQASLDDRLLAASALRSARVEVPEVMASLAQIAQTSTDEKQRLRVLQTFDGTSETAFIPAFVQGLQDPNPSIRRQAADSLSGLKTDPTVAQWLQYIAQSDPDARVREEAKQALAERSRSSSDFRGPGPR